MKSAISSEAPEGRLGRWASRSARRAGARREARHADEVRRLVDASFGLIRETGALEPRVSEILRRAGLSNQAFYRHFRSKDELLLCVLEEGVRLLAGYLEHRMAQAHGTTAAVVGWLEGVLEQALQSEAAAATRPFAMSRARLAELFPDEVLDSEEALIAPLRSALVSAAEEGWPGDPGRDAEALYLLAMGWLQRSLARAEPSRREDAEHVVRFALGALGLEASSRSVGVGHEA